jgi:hypothetical protein
VTDDSKYFSLFFPSPILYVIYSFSVSQSILVGKSGDIKDFSQGRDLIIGKEVCFSEFFLCLFTTCIVILQTVSEVP